MLDWHICTFLYVLPYIVVMLTLNIPQLPRLFPSDRSNHSIYLPVFPEELWNSRCNPRHGTLYSFVCNSYHKSDAVPELPQKHSLEWGFPLSLSVFF